MTSDRCRGVVPVMTQKTVSAFFVAIRWAGRFPGRTGRLRVFPAFQGFLDSAGAVNAVGSRGRVVPVMTRIGASADEVKILGETSGGYIVDADGWSFESCPGCGTLVGEWLTEDGPDVMLLVECPMRHEASRDEEWWF